MLGFFMSFCLSIFSVFCKMNVHFIIWKKEHLPCFPWWNKEETLSGSLTFLILFVCSIPDYKLKQEKKQTGTDFLTISSSPSSPHGIFFFPAAAAAKLLQSCPTLCDPIDGSPPGSPVPGILQARTLEWVAISFSNVLNIGVFAAFTAYVSTILIWDRTTSGDSQSTLWRRDLSVNLCWEIFQQKFAQILSSSSQSNKVTARCLHWESMGSSLHNTVLMFQPSGV